MNARIKPTRRMLSAVQTSIASPGSILAAAAIVAAVSSIAKLAAVARDLVIAHRFGVGDDIDAFFVALLVPTTVAAVLAGSISSAIVPIYVDLRQNHDESRARAFAANLLAALAAFTFALTVLLALAAPQLVRVIGGGFAPEKRGFAAALLMILTPLVMLQTLAGFWGCLVNARQRFAVVALLPVATPAVTATVILWWGQGASVEMLAVAYLLGGALEIAALFRLAAAFDLPIVPRWRGFDAPTRRALAQCASLGFGAAMMGSTQLVDQAMAAWLGPGSVSMLNYGGRLVAVVLTFVALPISVVSLPRFSQYVAGQDWTSARRTIRRLGGATAAVAIPLTLILAAISGPIVDALFVRDALGSREGALIAEIQVYYLLQLPFYLLGLIGVRMLSALGRNSDIALIATINFFANIGLNLVFMRWLGVAGIALATSVVYMVSTALIFVALRHRMPDGERRPAWRAPK